LNGPSQMPAIEFWSEEIPAHSQKCRSALRSRSPKRDLLLCSVTKLPPSFLGLAGKRDSDGGTVPVKRFNFHSGQLVGRGHAIGPCQACAAPYPSLSSWEKKRYFQLERKAPKSSSEPRGKLFFRTRRRGGRVAECGGLLNVPPHYRFNIFNNLQLGEGCSKWGPCASFGSLCSPHCSPIWLGSTVYLTRAVRRRLRKLRQVECLCGIPKLARNPVQILCTACVIVFSATCS